MSFSLATYLKTDRDYRIGTDGRLELTIDEDTVVERLQTRLTTWLGDWYLDTSRGIDYKGKILGQAIGGSEISAILRREILLERGVERIESFFLVQEPRNPRGFTVAAEVIINGADEPVTVTV